MIAIAHRWLLRAVTALTVGALASCGGGGGGGDDDGGTTPPPATQAPQITAQPSDRSVVEGASATFSVTAVGAAPLAYQWSGSADGTTYAPIAGATDSSLTLAGAMLAQSGQRVRVAVSNGVGSTTSSAATLTVTRGVQPPAITVQPADQSVTAPQPATFSVTATGTSIEYEWQSSIDGVAFTPIAGANAATLVVAPTSTAQSGQLFRVRVFSSTSVISSSARLTVAATPNAPVVTTQPMPQTIVAGASASFLAAATGNPAPALRWRLNGVPLSDGMITTGVCAGATASGTTTINLVLANVPLGCSGAAISVVASNGVIPDANSVDVFLVVTPAPAAPVIAIQPIDVSVGAGAQAVFSATASGVPTPTVQWQQSSDGGVTFANIVGATATSYTTPATTTGDDGKRLRAVFSNASGTATTRVARLTVTAAVVTVSLVAGDIGGAGTIDGTGTAARFDQPRQVAADGAGNLYVADTGRMVIRKITPAGVVTTLAGGAQRDIVDGTGAAAGFQQLTAIASTPAGTLYVVDSTTIRRVTAAGVVTTIAGDPAFGGFADGTGTHALLFAGAIAIAPDGTIYFTDSGRIRTVTDAGVVRTGPSLVDSQTGLPVPQGNLNGLEVDASGTLWVLSDATVRTITPAGVVTLIAGSATVGYADGTGAAARFSFPNDIAIDGTTGVYVSDSGNAVIRRVTRTGVVTTVAGSVGRRGYADGAGASALFGDPAGLAVTGAGVFIVDYENNVVRRFASGQVTTFAGSAARFGLEDGAGAAARFASLSGIAIDAGGNAFVSDSGNNNIRKVDSAGNVTTVAGGPGVPGNTDGTGTAARFRLPLGLAFTPSGSLVIADASNYTIRSMTPAGVVTTFAGVPGSSTYRDGAAVSAGFLFPVAVAVNAAGRLLVSDEDAATVRSILGGSVTTYTGLLGDTRVADGTLAAARFVEPGGITFDAAGTAYIADTGGHVIRKIVGSTVTTLAGAAEMPGSADGTGSSAKFATPIGVAVDAAGNVYVADSANASIRKITPAGVVTTVVGKSGEVGTRLGSDGRLDTPRGIALLSPGRLLVTTPRALLLVTLPP